MAPEGGDRLVVKVVGALGAEDRVHTVGARPGREKSHGHCVRCRACETSLHETSLREEPATSHVAARVLLVGLLRGGERNMYATEEFFVFLGVELYSKLGLIRFNWA